MFLLFSAIAILAPALLAGFRDSGIGTDTLIYVDDVWDKFKHIYEWDQFYKYYKRGDFDDIEFVYLVLNFVASRFGKNVGYIYFLANFIVVLFIYLAAYDNRKKASMWLVMFFFLFMYYNNSLNLVRQSITLSFCIYAFKYLEQRKWIKFGIWFFIILSSHNTGIFYLPFVGIYLIMNIKRDWLRNFLLVVVLILLVILFSSADALILFLVSVDVLPSKFLSYLTTESSENRNKIMTSIFVNYLLFAVIIYYIKLTVLKQKNKIVNKELSLYAYSKFVGAILFSTSLISEWAFRVSYYINYPVDCLFVPRALQVMKEHNKFLYIIVTWFCVLLVIFVWYWTFILANANETYPYKSKILEI